MQCMISILYFLTAKQGNNLLQTDKNVCNSTLMLYVCVASFQKMD